MKKVFLRTWFVTFVSLVVFLLILSSIFRPLVNLETLQVLRMETLVVMIGFVIALVIGVSILIAGMIVLRQKITESAVQSQLEAVSKGQSQQLKERAQESWFSPLFVMNLDDFYEETNQLATRLDQLATEMQQLAAQPQYVGQETREEIVEAERHRIARELHDSVSQQLFAAMMMLSAMSEQQEQLTPAMQQQMRMIEKVINDSQSEMRALLLHLRPISLENKTLKQGIESLLRELQTKVQMTLQWDLEEVTLLAGIEDHLFRITQELLSNALRHAKATSLEVYLKNDYDQVTLRVMDDGVGFDPDIKKASSYGLSNIKERVQSMGGTLKIISFPNQGSIIDIKIPKTQQTEVKND